MNINKSLFIGGMVLALTLSGCERLIPESMEDSDIAPATPESNSLLRVRTRGVSSVNEEAEDSKISYPVHVYAFNNKSACVGMQTILNDMDPIQFKLPEGNYKIYALGLDKDSLYDTPNMSDATPETPVLLKADAKHGDLMASSANVALTEGESNTLTLQMSRKVIKVSNIEITNMPEKVTGVKITIIPLGEKILVNGNVEGTNGSATFVLKKGEKAGTWQNAEEGYLLASGSPATVKISITYDSGETLAYSYASDEVLEANYILNIEGEFKANEVLLEGTVKGVSWAGTKTISFLIKENTGDVVKNAIPDVGTLYEGCYVLSHKVSDNYVEVHLMSTEELSNLAFEDNDNQASLETAIAKGLKELSPANIQLRLFNPEEREYIQDHVQEINTNLQSLGKTPLTLNPIVDGKYVSTDGYYTRRQSSGKITVYFIGNDKSLVNDDVQIAKSKGYRLRGFATVMFPKQK